MDYQIFMLGIIFAVIGWLLDRKDKKQGEEIKVLRDKHDEDILVLKTETKNTISSMKLECTTDVNKLYQLHHDNERKLAEHQLEIAKNHYPKQELDHRFSQLDTTIKDGFKSLSGDFKEMTKVLHDHMNSSHHNGQ